MLSADAVVRRVRAATFTDRIHTANRAHHTYTAEEFRSGDSAVSADPERALERVPARRR